jgi:hypothetical protein
MRLGGIGRALGLAAMLCWGCAQAQPLFFVRALPGLEPERPLPVLQRAAPLTPLRYRVIVITGSGCAGMGPIAERYFAGLQHAEVMVLHKPGVDLAAWPAPAYCGADFIARDNLTQWLHNARVALRAEAALHPANAALPTVLLGISEGAELLAALAPEVPGLQGLVLLSGSGLDPAEAGALQAQRLGQDSAWQQLQDQQQSALPDSAVRQGRSLGYWRSLWQWRQSQTLIDAPWPLLQVWGEDDALVPQAAYQRFGARAQNRQAPWCSWRMAGADHGLQHRDGGDGVQALWQLLENWARQPMPAGAQRSWPAASCDGMQTP